MPSRVVVYRNGSSEGNFDHILNSEVKALRKAFRDLRDTISESVTPCANERNCNGNGCTFCTPIITYIVALSQHNIRIVPAETKPGKNGLGILNVPSGTCLDDEVTPHLDAENKATEWPGANTVKKGQIFEDRNSDGFDFLLTAHGGLKGTSKPIFYRTVSQCFFFVDDLSPSTHHSADFERKFCLEAMERRRRMHAVDEEGNSEDDLRDVVPIWNGIKSRANGPGCQVQRQTWQACDIVSPM